MKTLNLISTKLRLFNISLVAILHFVGAASSLCQESSSSIEQLFIERYPYIMEHQFNERSIRARLNDSFGHLSDADKIRGLLFLTMKFESTHPMDYRPEESIPLIIRSSNEFIKDITELKIRMSSENDPRKFYLISKLGTILEKQQKADFIPSRIHMLFAVGKVANISVDSGYYRPEFGDVGIYTYKSIISNLKSTNAKYVPPPENSDLVGREKFESDRIDLAKWLKAHWPGCEALEIPGNTLKIKSATRPDLRPPLKSENFNKHAERNVFGDKPLSFQVILWVVGIAITFLTLLSLRNFRKS